MCDPETREQLRAVLIETYFSPEVRPALLEQGQVNCEVYEYSKSLMAAPEAGFGKEGAARNEKVRDQGFRLVRPLPLQKLRDGTVIDNYYTRIKRDHGFLRNLVAARLSPSVFKKRVASERFCIGLLP